MFLSEVTKIPYKILDSAWPTLRSFWEETFPGKVRSDVIYETLGPDNTGKNMAARVRGRQLPIHVTSEEAQVLGLIIINLPTDFADEVQFLLIA